MTPLHVTSLVRFRAHHHFRHTNIYNWTFVCSKYIAPSLYWVIVKLTHLHLQLMTSLIIKEIRGNTTMAKLLKGSPFNSNTVAYKHG